MGDCVLELGPLMPQLNDLYSGVGVRQHLSFARRRPEGDVVVGRFTVTLKMVVRFEFRRFHRETT